MTEVPGELINSNPNKRTFVYKRMLSDRYYCVKEQSYDSLNEANAALRESLMQCRVSHPYVCRVYAAELQQTKENEIKVAITLEFLEEDVDRHIQGRKRRNQPWSETELRTHALGLISALTDAQMQEICHRDIKPMNLLTNAEGSVIKICDFGCAKWIRELLPYHTILGTPLYFSPQVSRAFAQYLTTGSPNCSHNPYKSDVYSLGVCLLMMAALKNRIETKGIKNILALHRELNELSVSEEFKELLRTMLREDEESRPDFVQLQEIAKNLFAGSMCEKRSTAASEGLEQLISQSVTRLDPTDNPELPTIQTFRLSEAEFSFDATFERADSSCTYTFQSELPHDSILQRALCIVCGQETLGLDASVIQNQPLDIAEIATSVCSQACLATALEKAQCLSCCKETETQHAFYSFPCNRLHCFCKKECLVVFIARYTDNFRKTPNISCPNDHCEVNCAEIYAALGGEHAFHRLAFNIRLCVVCKEIKSYYQLGCRQHWVCVKCFEKLKKVNFRCLECEK